MCSTMYLWLTLILYIRPSTSLKITSQTTADLFPIQFPNPANPASFFRTTTTHQIEEISCPPGYAFDAKLLICQHAPRQFVEDGCLKSNLAPGNWPNPDSCRSFLGCNGVCCREMACPSFLLYNVSSDRCEYIPQTDCCEYREKNSARLVQ